MRIWSSLKKKSRNWYRQRYKSSWSWAWRDEKEKIEVENKRKEEEKMGRIKEITEELEKLKEEIKIWAKLKIIDFFQNWIILKNKYPEYYLPPTKVFEHFSK